MIINSILKGMFMWLIERAGLIPEEMKPVIEQRKKACSECPLRSGNFCSIRKSIIVRTGEKEMTPFGFEADVYKKIKGCSCWLPFKRLTSSPCPRGVWEHFVIKK